MPSNIYSQLNPYFNWVLDNHFKGYQRFHIMIYFNILRIYHYKNAIILQLDFDQSLLLKKVGFRVLKNNLFFESDENKISNRCNTNSQNCERPD